MNNTSKKAFEKVSIFSLSGPGVIMAEEDISFHKNIISKFTASSAVKWKTMTGVLYSVKVADIERETRTQVSLNTKIYYLERIMAQI